jgi:hypothetical protein
VTGCVSKICTNAAPASVHHGGSVCMCVFGGGGGGGNVHMLANTAVALPTRIRADGQRSVSITKGNPTSTVHTEVTGWQLAWRQPEVASWKTMGLHQVCPSVLHFPNQCRPLLFCLACCCSTVTPAPQVSAAGSAAHALRATGCGLLASIRLSTSQPQCRERSCQARPQLLLLLRHTQGP